MASSSGRGDEAAIHYETTVRDNAGHHEREFPDVTLLCIVTRSARENIGNGITRRSAPPSGDIK